MKTIKLILIIFLICIVPMLFLSNKSNISSSQIRSCPLCFLSDSSQYMSPTAWNNRHKVELRKCNQCTFVFSASSTFQYETFICNDSYQSKQQDELLADAYSEHVPELFDEIIKKTSLIKGKTLDFGCGIGLSSLYLQKKGFTTYGIEQSKIYLEKHKDLNIISSDTLPTLPAEKNSFDLVIMKDVLEHVDNPMELLQDVISYVKPQGYFYIRVPNVYHYSFHWSIDTKSHVNHFSPQILMDLLKKNNMKKVDFIDIYDISTKVGKLYNFVFYKTRNFLPLYHQISLLYQKI